MELLPVGRTGRSFPSERDGRGRWAEEGTGEAKRATYLKCQSSRKRQEAEETGKDAKP